MKIRRRLVAGGTAPGAERGQAVGSRKPASFLQPGATRFDQFKTEALQYAQEGTKSKASNPAQEDAYSNASSKMPKF